MYSGWEGGGIGREEVGRKLELCSKETNKDDDKFESQRLISSEKTLSIELNLLENSFQD